MRYHRAFNIWTLPEPFLERLQPGQWVYAGEPTNKGIWCGIRSSGSRVVAWEGNIPKGKEARQKYINTLMQYARG